MAPLDRAVVESLVRDLGEREPVAEIVRAYLDLLGERGRAVAEAARSGDQTRLRRLSHTLGSSSAVVGAVELRDLCHELETAARPAGAAEVRDLLATCTATTRALTEWLAGP